MANVKISNLTSLAEGDIVTSTDVIPIVDASAGETKKSTSQAVVNAGLKAPGPIGGTTPNAITGTTGTFSALLSNAGRIGYITGAGGTVTQGSWLADVTINKPCGQIVVFNSTGDLTPFVGYAFIVYNSLIAEGDVVVLTQLAGASPKITYQAIATIDGAFAVSIICHSAAPVSGVTLSYAVIRTTTT